MVTSNISANLEAAIVAGRELAERRTQPDPDMVDTVNVNGRSVVVDAKGQPTNDRDKAYLQALAASTAQRELDVTIKAANRTRDVSAKLEPREVTEKECAQAYRKLLKDGAYRAMTGQSAGSVLSDTIEAMFGDDTTEMSDEQRILAEQQRARHEQEKAARDAAITIGRPYDQGRTHGPDGLVYDRRANAYRAPENVSTPANVHRGPR
ncbi:hypothetical protein [Rhodococcus sp. UNC23MFCrub1.1]|uniref:hypothetical protein n=1 Tax=Rhodococcus sp. UNC23MFCrub1.1 TaxID=1449068 RepID=UPI000482103A|nr:hypothetical protein [Rhodococcus sp. UNC23MFCrub1.1]